jgi:hypothetical protein
MGLVFAAVTTKMAFFIPDLQMNGSHMGFDGSGVLGLEVTAIIIAGEK